MKKIGIGICIYFCLLGQLLAQETANLWTVEDIILQEGISSVEISPKGDAVVWTKRRPSKKKDAFVTDLYLTRLLGDKDPYPTHRLTQGEDAMYSPIWSTDGASIYFLSARKGGKTLWRLNLYGGEAEAIDSFAVRPSSLRRWNDSTLVFIAAEKPSWYRQSLKKKKDNVVVVEDTAHFETRRLFAYDLKNKEVRRLTDNKYPVGSYAIDRDGKWLVTRHTMSPHYPSDGLPNPKVYLWNLETGEKVEILKEGFQEPSRFQFSVDHKGFYFTSTLSSDPEWDGAGIEQIHYFELATKDLSTIDLEWSWGAGGGYRVVGNDILVFLANGTTEKMQYYQQTDKGWRKLSVSAGAWDDHLRWLGYDADKQFAVVNYSTASAPHTYWVVKWELERGKVNLLPVQELVKLNTHLSKKKIAPTEVIEWVGALNDTVDGILYYPTAYEEGRKYPLVVAIHGGPSGVDMDRWSDRWAYYHQLLTQRGCFVFKPNYHGSSHHGQAFVESIKKHYYEYEVPDIISGIDYLDERGFIDRDSMALLGWSNGAILSIQLTVQYPGMFKAAAPGAGDVNWTSDYGTCRFGVTFDQSYFGGAPWDDVNGKPYNEAYILKSPLFELEKVTTPTLICHGSEDRAVPRDQGWEYYRALQQSGKAPVRFLWFPGQPHGLQKITHQRRKVEEELRWFDTYLFGTYRPNPEVMKKGSPLAALKQKSELTQDGGRFGTLHQKVLIPQTVVAYPDSIAIGVFEVTHAQYQAFKQDHAYSIMQANQPITGLNSLDIQAYIDWVCAQTGEVYRLPNASEAKALHKASKSTAANENTLAYWAGYAPNPEDAKALLAMVEVEGYSLWTNVGHFPAQAIGQAHIYDLGGNAAEYYQAGSELRSYGYHAYMVYDPASSYEGHMHFPYTGFRLIKVLK